MARKASSSSTRTSATIALYEEKRAGDPFARRPLRGASRQTGRDTRRARDVHLLGNIELAHEAPHCLDRGAEGVGLYRTEFLYLNKTADPTEAEHYEAYKSVVQTIGPERPVVIRTLDLGADKFSSVSGLAAGEKNPFLGLRSVRLCLRKLDLFKITTSGHSAGRRPRRRAGDVPDDHHGRGIAAVPTLLNEVKEDLEEEGIPFNPSIRVGTMIEVPSAASDG